MQGLTMSILINTNKKMTLPWFIRASVASAGIFREILFFFVYAHRLGKVGCQLYARNYGNGSLRLRVIRFMHGILGSFCLLENIEDDGLTVETH